MQPMKESLGAFGGIEVVEVRLRHVHIAAELGAAPTRSTTQKILDQSHSSFVAKDAASDIINGGKCD